MQMTISPGKLAFGGDDSAGNTSRDSHEYVHRMTEIHAELGMESEMEATALRWDMKFLGSMGYPVLGDQSIVAGPLLNRFFAKSGWSVEEQFEPASWNHGVAIGWQKLVNYIPPARAVVQAVLRSSCHAKPQEISVHGSFRSVDLVPKGWWQADEPRFWYMMTALELAYRPPYGSLCRATGQEFIQLMGRVDRLPTLTDHPFVWAAASLE